MQYDEEYGWFHKKDLKTWIETQEYATTAYLNPKGLRGQEHTYEKPYGFKRILVLGDSMAFGLGVNDDESFPAKLQHLYEAEGEKGEVINMGLNGYSTDQQLLLLKNEGLKYSPDVVICQFYIGNDVQGNSSAVMYGKNKPYFILEEGELKLKNYPASEIVEDITAVEVSQEPKGRINLPFIKEFLQRHSYAYVFLRLRYNYLLHKLGVRGSVSDQISEQGWEVTKAIILEMKKTCDKNNADLLLLFVPTKEQMLGAESDEYRRKFVEFTEKNNIKYVDFLELFKGRKDLNFTIDCHWNIKGNEFVAETVYIKLEDIHD
jgi:lysophospholipase L1-like esterase